MPSLFYVTDARACAWQNPLASGSNHGVVGLSATVLIGVGAAVIIGLIIIAMRRGRFRLPAWAGRPKTWMAIVVGGAVIRLAWGALLPATLTSDPRDYYDLAMRLLTEGRYYSVIDITGLDGRPTGMLVNLLAWRAPGLPILLAGWFGLFGAGTWAIVALNLVIYFLSALVLGRVAMRLTGPSSVAPVLFVFAIWPKHIGYTGVPLTENLSLLLLLFCVLLFDLALAGSRRALVFTGLTYGIAALVRPSLLLLPALWAGMAWTSAGLRWRPVLAVATATLIGMAVIAPWTIRNMHVLGHPVLISTNGGDVLYRANNPLASGNWSPAGERDLNAFIRDEVRWNTTGSAWAWEWIKLNPAAFSKLVVRKIGFLWGWEEEGILFKMHYPEIILSAPIFAAVVSTVMNAWWFILLCAVAASLIYKRAALTQSALAVGLMSAVLLLTAVHMLYESHARYHMPFTAELILLAFAGPFLAAPVWTTARGAKATIIAEECLTSGNAL